MLNVIKYLRDWLIEIKLEREQVQIRPNLNIKRPNSTSTTNHWFWSVNKGDDEAF